MRIRTGYVSNSSSASFIIEDIRKLTPQQVDAIRHHYWYAKANGFGGMEQLTISDTWHIELRRKIRVNGQTFESQPLLINCEVEYAWDKEPNTMKDIIYEIQGSTMMDNFPMEAFFQFLNIPVDAYHFHHQNDGDDEK